MDPGVKLLSLHSTFLLTSTLSEIENVVETHLLIFEGLRALSQASYVQSTISAVVVNFLHTRYVLGRKKKMMATFSLKTHQSVR